MGISKFYTEQKFVEQYKLNVTDNNKFISKKIVSTISEQKQANEKYLKELKGIEICLLVSVDLFSEIQNLSTVNRKELQTWVTIPCKWSFIVKSGAFHEKRMLFIRTSPKN